MCPAPWLSPSERPSARRGIPLGLRFEDSSRYRHCFSAFPNCPVVGTCTELGLMQRPGMPSLGSAKCVVCVGAEEAPLSCVQCSPSFILFWQRCSMTVSRRNAPAEPLQSGQPTPSQSPGAINTETVRCRKGARKAFGFLVCIVAPPLFQQLGIWQDSLLCFLVDSLTFHLKIQTVCWKRPCVLPNI